MCEFIEFYDYINMRYWIHIVAATRQMQAAGIIGFAELKRAYDRADVTEEE